MPDESFKKTAAMSPSEYAAFTGAMSFPAGVEAEMGGVPLKPADSESLTEEWLRSVGLYEDTFRLTWRGPGEQRLAFMIKGHRSDCEWAFCPAYCKTREDVRTLCRLLGVPLEE